MEIIKHTKDLNVSEKMANFISYLNESVESCIVKEKIRNKKMLLKLAKMKNNFVEYNYFQSGTSLGEMYWFEDKKKKN